MRIQTILKNILVLIFGTQTIFGNPNTLNVTHPRYSQFLEYFSWQNIDAIICALFVFIMAVTSNYFYNHKGKRYATGKKEKIKSPVSFSYVYRYIQLSTIIASLGSYMSSNGIFLELHDSLILQYLGLSVATIAMAFFITAKLNLGDHYSPCFDSYVPKDIIQDGLYKYIRHPIYMANILLLIGMTVSTGSIWILINVVLLCTYYFHSAANEENVLVKRFPSYKRYMQRTNMIIPTVKLFKHNVKHPIHH